jgi:hypothetical protein
MGITAIQDQASGLRRLFHPQGAALGWPVVHAVSCPDRPALVLPLVQSLVHAWADQGFCLAWVDELPLDRREGWPWPCPVRFDLGQSVLDHVPLAASLSALDDRVWFASARQMQRVVTDRGWPVSRRLLDSGVAFDALCLAVDPRTDRLWSAYGASIHHTVVVGAQREQVESALRWMTQVPVAGVASWRVLLVGAEPGAVAPSWVSETAAALLGQPLEVLGPVPARWQDAQLTADLTGLDAMQRVLLERLMRG